MYQFDIVKHISLSFMLTASSVRKVTKVVFYFRSQTKIKFTSLISFTYYMTTHRILPEKHQPQKQKYPHYDSGDEYVLLSGPSITRY